MTLLVAANIGVPLTVIAMIGAIGFAHSTSGIVVLFLLAPGAVVGFFEGNDALMWLRVVVFAAIQITYYIVVALAIRAVYRLLAGPSERLWPLGLVYASVLFMLGAGAVAVMAVMSKIA